MSVIEVSEATFERDVLERSREVPVVVDFWAEWCGPCRALGPILEKLALEANGAWILAQVDVDSNPQLAAAAGVQGIPAVRAFRNGKQVAEFVGAIPEDQVRAWLQRLGPSPADLTFEEGLAAERRGDLPAAADAFRAALNLDPGHGDATSGLARVELALRARDADLPELQRLFDHDPTDAGTATGLADAYAVSGDLTSSFEVLLSAVAATAGDERETVRKHLIDLLATVPADDPRALETRRALSRLLF